MSSAAKKILVAVILAVAIGGYVYWSSSRSSTATASSASDAAFASTVAAEPSSTAVASGNSVEYKDGTYTGSAANSIYGNVQVSATISGGKIADVTFLQHPDSQPHSVDVSAMSMPILKSEAIASQNANVDIVSGATQTSEAFVQTLQSALSQAQS